MQINYKYCQTADCIGVPAAKGLCRKHYDRKRYEGLDKEPGAGQTKDTCQRDGCEREVYCRRICRAHYQQDYRKRAWDKKIEQLRKEVEQ